MNGHQVAPAELEDHLLNHPSVHDCVVIGVPSLLHGEVPKAFIVLGPDTTPSEDTKEILEKWVTGSMAAHQALLGGIEFVDSIPKTASGKLLRRVFRDLEKGKRAKETIGDA